MKQIFLPEPEIFLLDEQKPLSTEKREPQELRFQSRNKNTKKVFYINNLTLLTHICFIQKRIYLKISHIQYNEHIAPYNSLSLMHH